MRSPEREWDKAQGKVMSYSDTEATSPSVGKRQEKEEPQRCDKQLGEGVAVATKVVKSFKEKVINTVKCSGEFP